MSCPDLVARSIAYEAGKLDGMRLYSDSDERNPLFRDKSSHACVAKSVARDIGKGDVLA